jgi:DNA-binding ferritin-like protein
MYDLIVYLRALQLATQHFHNLVKGPQFHEDHEFFSDVYTMLTEDYDAIIERIIGTQGESGLEIMNLISNVNKAMQGCPSIGKSNEEFYTYTKEKLYKIKGILESQCKKPDISEGTKQLLGGIADKYEVECYKIQRRLGVSVKKEEY